jgi:deoxyribonuclease NucA/NucB
MKFSMPPPRQFRRAGTVVAAAILAILGIVATGTGASAASSPALASPGVKVTSNAHYGRCSYAAATPTRQFCIHSAPVKHAAPSAKQVKQRAASMVTAAAAASNTGTGPTSCNFGGDSTYNPQPDRFTSCNQENFELSAILYVDGEPEVTGTLLFTDEQWANYSGSSLTWTHGINIVIGAGWGTLDGGTLTAVYSICDFYPGVCADQSSTTPDGTLINLTPYTTWTNQWTESDTGNVSTTASSTDTLDNYLGVWFSGLGPAGYPAWSGGDYGDGLYGRCDNIARTIAGCVDEDFIPTVVYDATKYPLVQPVAQHIYDAEQIVGGLDPTWGTPLFPLTRDMNPADKLANYQAACGGVTIPSGDSCDEYPMASTYQGASLQSAYSIAIVPISANKSQGGITNRYYRHYRLIDSDPFYVLAILSNGTQSW